MVSFLVMVDNRLLYLTDLSIICLCPSSTILQLMLKIIYFDNTKEIKRGNVRMINNRKLNRIKKEGKEMDKRARQGEPLY